MSMGAILASVGPLFVPPLMIAKGIIKRRPQEIPTANPPLPQIVSEEVRTYAQRQARKRRGLGSTILTGDMSIDPAQIGKKALLGS